MASVHDLCRRPLNLLPALLVAIITALLTGAGLFHPFEDALTARRAELLNRSPSGQIVIVEIDARSLAGLPSWPWPRNYHAAVIRRLHEAGASIMAFDVDFSARSSKGDEALVSAIRDGGQIILPIFEQKASGRADDRALIASRPDAAFERAWVGGVNIFPGADGVVRDYPAATRIGGAIQPSIATLLAEKNGLGDRSFQPDWSIDARKIRRFSFVDAMTGRIPVDELRGKRILIGATAIEMGDRFAVPRFGVIPGVVVQAIATDSLLQDRAIVRTGNAVTVAGILLLALLLAPRPLDTAWRASAVFAAALAAILMAPILVQRSYPVSIDTAPWLFAWVLAVLVQASIEARRRLRLRAEFDTDSGLPNRSMLEKSLTSAASCEPVVVTAAIERFDMIRDSIGLAATSDLLRATAEIIQTDLRRPVYRVAADTLAWTLEDADDKMVAQLVRRVQSSVRDPVSTPAGPVDVTFTAGIAPHAEGTPVLQIERALTAIGSARSSNKAWEWYRETDPQLRRQLSMMSDLRHAMDKGRLSLAYQPKMAIENGCIGDAEALIRWVDENGNKIAPDEFIPLAEATGVIHEITLFALRSAIADLAHWARQGLAMRVAVNVSAIDLAADSFVQEIDRVLAAMSVPPSQLTLEITESALIRTPEAAIATLTALRQRGIRLSVDDYGTGQSTLSYLKHLPVHELKIDKSFITDLATNESDQIMVRSTIGLAHDLGLQVVAEGIEDRATLDCLRTLRCDYGQGFLISPPVQAAQLITIATEGYPFADVA